MKINVTSAIRDFQGNPVALPDDGGPLTVRKILVDSLMFAHEDDSRLGGNDKVRLVKLALKVDAEDEPEMMAEDVAFLVARVDKMCPALTVYRMREILDPASL